MNHFNGDVLYNVTYKCDICDPKEGMIIECKVFNINKWVSLLMVLIMH